MWACQHGREDYFRSAFVPLEQKWGVPSVCLGAWVLSPGDLSPHILSPVFQEVWSRPLPSPTHQGEGLWGMFSRRTLHEINSILTLQMTLHINIQ